MICRLKRIHFPKELNDGQKAKDLCFKVKATVDCGVPNSEIGQGFYCKEQRFQCLKNRLSFHQKITRFFH